MVLQQVLVWIHRVPNPIWGQWLLHRWYEWTFICMGDGHRIEMECGPPVNLQLCSCSLARDITLRAWASFHAQAFHKTVDRVNRLRCWKHQIAMCKVCEVFIVGPVSEGPLYSVPFGNPTHTHTQRDRQIHTHTHSDHMASKIWHLIISHVVNVQNVVIRLFVLIRYFAIGRIYPYLTTLVNKVCICDDRAWSACV